MHSLEVQRMHRKYDVDCSPKESEKGISRRDFLKTMAAAGVMAIGGLSTTAATLEEMGVSKEKGKLLEDFLLDSLDYRNALIAKEIMHLLEEYKKVSVIYGAGHFKGIQKLLKDPELLETKLEVYEKTYGLINNDSVDVYDFNKNKF